jgi:protease II
MDDQQARKVNQAAEKFAKTLIEAYQALVDRSVSAQELNAHLTQSFVNRVIENLGTQAESNRTLAGSLIEQQRKQQEASQTLARESVDAYMDFIGSMLAVPRQGRRVAEQAMILDPNEEPGEESDATQDDAAHHPLSSWMQTTETATSPQGEERIPREEPPPGEERPEKRGSVRTTPPTGRENPTPGEERPSRRIP